MIDPADLKVEGVADKPLKGMWHNGPNPSWVTVTHLPTMISARCYHRTQHKAREAAMSCVEMMVEESGADSCSFPETLLTQKEPE